jgi:hypothetical protein
MLTYSLNGQFLGKFVFESTLISDIFVSTAPDHSQIAMVVDADNSLHVLQLPFLRLLSSTSLNIEPADAIVLASSYDKASELVILSLSSGGVLLISPKI